MELKKLFTAEERAVSPVIAVVLMIAVTVILAAVVAAFALGLGGGADSAPQATFDFDYDDGGSVGGADDTFTITHEGGEQLDPAPVSVLINGAEDTNDNWGGADPIATGVSYTIDETALATDVLNEGDEVRVLWTGDGGTEATLGRYTVPG